LAAGTPCVAVDYAGGRELTPSRWRIRPRGWRTESIYALERPVLHPGDLADAAEVAIADRHQAATLAYCQGAVAHLGWDRLWPKWKGWIQSGLAALDRLDVEERVP
jgi:hypothetical protein